MGHVESKEKNSGGEMALVMQVQFPGQNSIHTSPQLTFSIWVALTNKARHGASCALTDEKISWLPGVQTGHKRYDPGILFR